jgi:rhodanese-related sulfurtransferase
VKDLTGARSKRFAEHLEGMGFTNIFVLDGGLSGYGHIDSSILR